MLRKCLKGTIRHRGAYIAIACSVIVFLFGAISWGLTLGQDVTLLGERGRVVIGLAFVLILTGCIPSFVYGFVIACSGRRSFCVPLIFAFTFLVVSVLSFCSFATVYYNGTRLVSDLCGNEDIGADDFCVVFEATSGLTCGQSLKKWCQEHEYGALALAISYLLFGLLNLILFGGVLYHLKSSFATLSLFSSPADTRESHSLYVI
eukprot:TRINITY_DN12719_c0_g1_i1.p1 TRINITY_DN12719_c0_g1~~TRINITY_DN12719_c0_g1_i1.p1  ORF type:complete len:205 (-),score=1.45 TRINITY_DN12719_c0_g1_i1:26-640(-)